MKRYLLAIDQGTTSCRSIIFDLEGKLIYASQKKLKQDYPQANWVEQDLEMLWEAQLETLKNCLNKISSSEILALGITNQRETIGLWNKNGQALTKAISWQCQRTKENLKQIANSALEAKVRKITGLTLNPYFSASKLQWLLEYYKLDLENILAGTIDTWLLYKLSGNSKHLTDVSNASRTLLFDINKAAWSEELLELFKIPKNILPLVCASQNDFGVTAKSVLGCEIPIMSLIGDQQAALYGQACLKLGMAELTCGTGGFLLVNSGAAPDLSDGLLTSIAWQFNNSAKTYTQEASILSVGSTIEWLNRIGLIPKTENLDYLIEDAQSGVLVMPAITGYGSPDWKRDIKGQIIGLSAETDGASILKGSIEGIAFRVKEVINSISHLSELRLAGGLSKSDYFCQFLADLLKTPILRSKNVEASAWGAASLANLNFTQDKLLSLWQDQERFNPKNNKKALAAWQTWKEAFAI